MANDDERRETAADLDAFELNDASIEDDELRSLFGAFDEVSASDELQQAALSAVFAAADEGSAAAPKVEAVAGGAHPRGSKRARWRAMRFAAIAACLALALSGGVAYAVPATYYEVAQGETVITLGVNVFGITVSADANDETGREIVEGGDLCNKPYEEALSQAVGRMEEHDPSSPVEFGPRGGEREVRQPQDDRAAPGDAPAELPQDGNWNERGGQPQGDGAGGQGAQPQGGSQQDGQGGPGPQNGQDGQEAQAAPEGQPQYGGDGAPAQPSAQPQGDGGFSGGGAAGGQPQGSAQGRPTP